ncbi:competence protein ComGG [Anoxybacillus kamchatkensis]|uniref:competence type IV pilus minor pilin ComGG n=1 Tax=Anoxybacillus ayderensis TaxID=265546 RepID=UPI0015EBE9F0|nr:competence type IV pilus minor pilin ComGG [Anoxybacillus ayderensis]MBA2878989.1 competence protein ComGG [Anoxybacillus ayderensis]MCL6617983.1 competence protein comGG [Anoxybacillus ayderensis]
MKRLSRLFDHMKNEQGVILPFTVMCALFISALFLHSVALYHTDIQFFEEEKKWYEADYLMKQTLIHVKQTLANAPENVPSLSQTISFPRGRATYHATKNGADVWFVNVSCITNAQFRYDVQFQFHVLTNDISGWKELY